MRQPIQRTAQDLANALNNITRFTKIRTRKAQAQMSVAIAESIQEILPEADVSISQNSQNSLLDISDNNLLAREMGSPSQAADMPITRALDTITNR